MLATCVGLFFGAPLKAQKSPAGTDSQATAGAAVKNVGAVKSISGKSLVLKTDAGPEVTISVPDGARIVRLAAGQTDLKSAPAIAFPETRVGARMLLAGRAGEKGKLRPQQLW